MLISLLRVRERKKSTKRRGQKNERWKNVEKEKTGRRSDGRLRLR